MSSKVDAAVTRLSIFTCMRSHTRTLCNALVLNYLAYIVQNSNLFYHTADSIIRCFIIDNDKVRVIPFKPDLSYIRRDPDNKHSRSGDYAILGTCVLQSNVVNNSKCKK